LNSSQNLYPRSQQHYSQSYLNKSATSALISKAPLNNYWNQSKQQAVQHVPFNYSATK